MKVFFENRQRMLESRKVRDRLDDEETFGLEREKSSYPDRLPLHLTRVMFRQGRSNRPINLVITCDLHGSLCF